MQLWGPLIRLKQETALVPCSKISEQAQQTQDHNLVINIDIFNCISLVQQCQVINITN